MCAASSCCRPQRLRDRVDDQRRIAHRRQPDPEHPGAELAHQLPRRLDRQPRLPRPTRPGERHQPRRLVANERDNLRHLLLATHERGERHREVRVRDRPQRRKASGSELEQRHRFGEVLQPVPAQVEHTVGDQLAGRSREQHLAAMRRAHDPRRLVHVRADVLGRIEQRLARVHANPNPHRPIAKRGHRLLHGRHRCRRRRERVEQAVARVIDLVTGVAPKASRKARRWSASASLYASAPRSSRSAVEPSMSVKTSVTVPEGCTVTDESSAASNCRTSRHRERGDRLDPVTSPHCP